MCDWKELKIIEKECCPDHIHMLLEIAPKMSVAAVVGYLKGKSSLMIYEQFEIQIWKVALVSGYM